MKAKITHLRLTQIMRQKDRIDGNRLSRVRTASQTDEDIHFFNENVIACVPFNATILCLYKAEATRRNNEALMKLPGEMLVFEEERTGSAKKKAKDGNYLVKSKFAPRLLLKKDCRIIIKKNGTSNIHGVQIPYVNGDTGRLLEIDAKGRMSIERDDGDIIRFNVDKMEDNKYVKEVSWEMNEETAELEEVPRIAQKCMGRVAQYPVSLGYSQTIHSVQGQTLKCVHVVLPPSPCEFLRKCPNLLYVGFSRTTNLKNLTLNRPIAHDDIVSTLKGGEKDLQQYELGV